MKEHYYNNDVWDDDDDDDDDEEKFAIENDLYCVSNVTWANYLSIIFHIWLYNFTHYVFAYLYYCGEEKL